MSQRVIAVHNLRDGPRLEERVAVHLREDVSWAAAPLRRSRWSQHELRARYSRSTARGLIRPVRRRRAMGPLPGCCGPSLILCALFFLARGGRRGLGRASIELRGVGVYALLWRVE